MAASLAGAFASRLASPFPMRPSSSSSSSTPSPSSSIVRAPPQTSIVTPFRSHAPLRWRSGRISATSAAGAGRQATLKSRLAAGETLYGMFLLSGDPTLAEIAGLAGYDYVVVDMEHGPGGISSALTCLRALAAAATPSILRLPESSAVWAKKALDIGPQGIMFPMVDGASSAAAAVSFCRYPPRGLRGAAHPVVRASCYGIDDDYLEHYEEELLIMCQVETEKAAMDVEAIAAVEGVDCIQMGPLDLSAAMGFLWKPGHRKVRETMADLERRVLATAGGAAAGGAYLSGFAMPYDPPEEMKRRGYSMVAGAVDLGMFRQAAVEDVQRFRTAPGSSEAADAGEEGDENEKAYWSE